MKIEASQLYLNHKQEPLIPKMLFKSHKVDLHKQHTSFMNMKPILSVNTLIPFRFKYRSWVYFMFSFVCRLAKRDRHVVPVIPVLLLKHILHRNKYDLSFFAGQYNKAWHSACSVYLCFSHPFAFRPNLHHL